MRNDQVKISFGPARYDSPKAIRKQIEDAKQETQESTIQEITNNPDLNIAGGGGFIGDVTAYDPATRGGTATSNGVSYEFINSTGTALDIGDEVIINEIDDEYYVVGVTARVGDITPVPLPPAAALSPNFPLDGTNIPFPIDHGTNTGLKGGTPRGHDFAYDMSGGLGLGTDVILGHGTASNTVVNGFARSTSSSVSLFGTAVASNDSFYVQNSGTVFQMDNINVFYRTLGAPSWTTPTGTYGVDTTIFDHYSEAMWYASIEGSAPYRCLFYRMNPADSAPVQVAAMDIRSRYDISTVARSGGVATFTTAINHTYQLGQTLDTTVTSPAGFSLSNVIVTGVTANTFTVTSAGADVAPTAAGAGSFARFDNEFPTFALYAGHGYLIFRNATDYYIKASGDDTPFTFIGTVPSVSFDPLSAAFGAGVFNLAVTPNGDLSYVYKSGITTTWHLRVLNTSTLIVSDYDTGIPSTYSRTFAGPVTYTRDALQGLMHTESGLVLLPGIATNTELAEPTNGFYPALAAFNYVSSTYVYWDPDMVDDMSADSHILSTVPVEVAAGTVRYASYSQTDQNPSIGILTRHYELSGL